jgi:hypothetical protein
MDDDLVCAAAFPTPVDAELARMRLQSEGIEAVVVEAASFNPMLSSALGNEVRVREPDLERARGVLGELIVPEAGDDGEGEDVVRCPRCELAYCSLTRLRAKTSTTVPLAGLLSIPFLLFEPKRWYCEKCEHVWDNPKDGPKAMTPLLPGDPRPVFRLRRRAIGMGVFLGLVAGFLFNLIVPVGFVALFGAVFGGVVGSLIEKELCSEPGCRAQLTRHDTTCARCKGSVAGAIERASEHYVAAADFRRELAALRKKDGNRSGKARPKRKKAALPASGDTA